MDKGLKEYELYIKNKIEQLNKDKPDISHVELKNRVKILTDYHNNKVLCFQHERLVHLIITLFFATLLITTVIVMFLPIGYELNIITNMLTAIALILFIVELFYVKYYYYLENGTQRLYRYSKQLFDLTD